MKIWFETLFKLFALGHDKVIFNREVILTLQLLVHSHSFMQTNNFTLQLILYNLRKNYKINCIINIFLSPPTFSPHLRLSPDHLFTMKIPSPSCFPIYPNQVHESLIYVLNEEILRVEGVDDWVT